MERLFAHWQEVKPLLAKCHLTLFLDYDGTLTPIVEDPSKARLSSETKKILRKLVRTDELKTILISGRSIADLKKLVGIQGVIYVGNHGFELEGPALRSVHPSAIDARQSLKEVTTKLQHAFQHFEGLLIENKEYTVSVHYRRLRKELMDEASALFDKVLKPYLKQKKLATAWGKKVWEVRPVAKWNKGTTLLWLFRRSLVHSPKRVLPIYLGDDQTDEDAFKVIKRRGLGIKVTENPDKKTEANYFLRSPDEVLDFLKRIYDIKNSKEERRVLITHS